MKDCIGWWPHQSENKLTTTTNEQLSPLVLLRIWIKNSLKQERRIHLIHQTSNYRT